MNKLLGWLKNKLLPFENPDHPLYTPPHIEPDLSDWDDLGPYTTGNPGAFHKNPEWMKWGNKWYKKSK